MNQMYSAIPNSPSTTIVGAISDTQQIIDVADGSILPSAPNLLTIGYNTSNTETVLLTNKTANQITITRGIEGGQYSFPSGSLIARIFTAYDYNSIKENIEGMQNNIRYVNIDFGISGNETYILTNVSDSWIKSTSNISAKIVCETSVDRSPEDSLIENMSVGISDIVDGSCNLHCHAPNGAIGIYKIILTGR